MRWPCVFRGRFIREVVDPRVQTEWKSHRNEPAPFGDLRAMWRMRHCAVLNPYGSESCPYSERDCALAFLTAIQNSVDKPKARGYFRTIIRTLAFERAERKPLARGRMDVHIEARPSDPGTPYPGTETGPGVYRPSHRPNTVGDVLRTLDIGSRQMPSPDVEEAQEQ